MPEFCQVTKKTLDGIFGKLHVQPVGCGYIDCICPKSSITTFIDALNSLSIHITDITWWCLVVGDVEPCGLGGPQNWYGSGWYSEIVMDATIQFLDNERFRRFLIDEWPNSMEYSPCYVPAFWLDVPNDRRNPWCGKS